MAATDLPNFDLSPNVPARLMLRGAEISTETLDLDCLFPVDIAGSGMFELKGHQELSLATLLDALPVCALLIDRFQRIRMLNHRCKTICRERSQLKRTSFSSLFPVPLNASKAGALIDRVLRERKPKTWEAQMELQGNRMWARMHLRPLRMEGELYVLLVLQDMTVERRQLYIIKKNEHELRRWAAELERRVAKRANELEQANAQLRREIVERKRAQDALRKINQELEPTESAAMGGADATIRAFSQLKQHGIHICIDDFGTGHLSLSYLKRFSIDNLKIDKVFVEYIASNSDDAALAETIIAIAHTLKMKVVAEGVESREQLNFFRARNCDEWQGFYYSRPLPSEEAAELIQQTGAVPSATDNATLLQQLITGSGADYPDEAAPSLAGGGNDTP